LKACDTHAPFCWESEPSTTFAHTPLPSNSIAALSPNNCLQVTFILRLLGWTHKQLVPEVFPAVVNKFRKLGLISYNGLIEVHNSLLSAVLHEKPLLKERDYSRSNPQELRPQRGGCNFGYKNISSIVSNFDQNVSAPEAHAGCIIVRHWQIPITESVLSVLANSFTERTQTPRRRRSESSRLS
jgi:hypothetical protein